MNSKETNKDTYGGMMYSMGFKYWYTYLKRRIAKGWSAEEVSFLLGRAPFSYVDFEQMHDVENFLHQERILLDRIYQDSTVERMVLLRESYETNEERLVRVYVEDDLFYKDYEIVIPWTLAGSETYMEGGKKKTRICPIPDLKFREWKMEESLEQLSDATIDIRDKLNKLLKLGYLKEGRAPYEIFKEVEFTGQHNLQIFPRHVKDGLFNLIKAGNVFVRNMEGRYLFFEV